jgi:hypothetical protein
MMVYKLMITINGCACLRLWTAITVESSTCQLAKSYYWYLFTLLGTDVSRHHASSIGIVKRVIISSGSCKTLEVPVFLGIYSDLTLYLRIRKYFISFSSLFPLECRGWLLLFALCAVSKQYCGRKPGT